MKKIILIILVIFCSSSLYASEMNKLLEQNYKIIKTELVKFEKTVGNVTSNPTVVKFARQCYDKHK